MLPWMIFVTLATVLSVVGGVLYFVYTEWIRRADTEALYDELDTSDDGLGAPPLPSEQIAAYEQARQEMHDTYFPNEPLIAHIPGIDNTTSDDEDEDVSEEEGTTTEPWHRRLPPQAKGSLKTLLIKRAMAGIPSVRRFMSEYSARSYMHRLRLLDPQRWEKIEAQSEALDKEMKDIRREAEAIQENWGKQDLVFRDAHGFFMHEQRKAEFARYMEQKKEEERRQLIEQEKERKIAQVRLQAMVEKEARMENNRNKKSVKEQKAA